MLNPLALPVPAGLCRGPMLTPKTKETLARVILAGVILFPTLAICLGYGPAIRRFILSLS